MDYQIGVATLSVLSILLLIAAWRLTDWSNWDRYYPTILFIVLINLTSTILQSDHRLWHFHKLAFIPNHMTADFFIAFTHLPLIVLVFLSRYPDQASRFKQVAFTIFWIVSFSLVEAIIYLTNNISYHYGWTFWWSVVLWGIMFLVMRVHASKPLWAWLICISFSLFVIRYFHLPITELK